jgi:hypothetical protein
VPEPTTLPRALRKEGSEKKEKVSEREISQQDKKQRVPKQNLSYAMTFKRKLLLKS